MNYLNSLYQQVLLSISIVLSDYEKQVKVGRPPKVSDLQIACLYVMSWVHPASYHEVKSVRIRYQKSLWFRALADSFCLMGDRGYRGLEYVHVCEDKPDKGVRQVIEAVNSQIKLFNGVSRWRNITTLLAYLQGYAIGYSFFRKSWLFK
jgi:hypothetical protein